MKKRFDFILKLLFVFSCPFFTILVSNRYDPKITLLGAGFSFLIAIFLYFEYLRSIVLDYKKLSISFILSLYIIKYFLRYENLCINFINEKIYSFSGITFEIFTYKVFSLFSCFFLALVIYLFIKYLFSFIVDFFKNLSCVEKKYLIIISCVGFICSIVVTYMTTAFSLPFHDGSLQIYDVIYTSDTGALTYEDAFFNMSYVENDIRQPLFGVFAFPFAVCGRIISEFLFFVPSGYEYAVAMTFIQFILFSVVVILISRMLDLSDFEKKLFYLFFSLSFTYLLFSILLEQYIISLFYLIICCYYRFKSKKINYLYVGSVGTLLTSGVIFFLVSSEKKLVKIIHDLLICFCCFLMIFIIFGQFPQLFTLFNNLFGLTSSFSGKVCFLERVYQYTNFISGIIFAPKSFITNVLNHPSYQLVSANSFSILGIIIFIVSILGFIFNRKQKFSQFCLFWICFSFFILCLIGWGTVENGLVLYNTYFGFAFLSLLFMFFKYLFKDKKLLIGFISLLCVSMLIFNCIGFYDLFRFAITYY